MLSCLLLASCGALRIIDCPGWVKPITGHTLDTPTTKRQLIVHGKLYNKHCG